MMLRREQRAEGGGTGVAESTDSSGVRTQVVGRSGENVAGRPRRCRCRFTGLLKLGLLARHCGFRFAAPGAVALGRCQGPGTRLRLCGT